MRYGRTSFWAAFVLLLTACASPKTDMPNSSTDMAGTQYKPAEAADSEAMANHKTKLDPLNDPSSPLARRSVYFDFDANAIKNEYQSTIEAHASYLKDNQDRKVVIQGNTDERGGAEYNLALGQRRAEAVKSAMQLLGAQEKQIEAISFGKEKPKATGHTEADYAENRRADIVYP